MIDIKQSNMSMQNTNTTELIRELHERILVDNLKLLEENEKLKKENEELKEERIDKWYECDGLQEERGSLNDLNDFMKEANIGLIKLAEKKSKENGKLKEHIVQLEKYITVNCFIPNDSTTTRDDVKDALNDAKEVLDCLRPSI